MTQNPQMFAQREVLALDQLSFERPADMTILQQLQNDHSLDAVAASLTRLGHSVPKGPGGNSIWRRYHRQSRNRSVTCRPASHSWPRRALASSPASSSAASRRLLKPEEARRLATEALRRQKLTQMLETQVKDMRSAAKIEYQPGYAPKEEPAAKDGAKAPATGG